MLEVGKCYKSREGKSIKIISVLSTNLYEEWYEAETENGERIRVRVKIIQARL